MDDSSRLYNLVRRPCEFDQDPSVPCVPSRGRPRTEPGSCMILSSFSLSLSVVLLLQQAPPHQMADATTESQQVLGVAP